ncbi:MAG: OmpA family protein [Bacteroidota bacterium]
MVNKTEFSRIHSFLRKYAEAYPLVKTIKIIGYTDTAGTGKYNQVLSQKRCQSVNDVVHQTIPANNQYYVQMIPLGERDATGKTDSLNRRVVLIINFLKKDVSAPAGAKPHENQVKKTQEIAGEKVVDTVIVLDHIYFQPDQPILTPGSMDALPDYISILKKYKNSYMEVGGHVNHTDSKLKNTDPLFKLSEKRAEVIYGYLIDYGFDSAKLTHKGYGNSQLLFSMPSGIEEKRKNMRVEITVFK